MISLRPTVTNISALYANYISGGESGWFAFVTDENKFYEWIDDKWVAVIFTETLVLTSWVQAFEDGIYIIDDSSCTDRPSELSDGLNLIVFTDYTGKQKRIVQNGQNTYYLVNGKVYSVIDSSVIPSYEIPCIKRPIIIPDAIIDPSTFDPSIDAVPPKTLKKTVSVKSDLYTKFPMDGEDGWFAFVSEEQKFYKWINGEWEIILITETLSIVTWNIDFKDGEYIVDCSNAINNPIGISTTCNLIVYTDYLGRQRKIIQQEGLIFSFINNCLYTIWSIKVTPSEEITQFKKKYLFENIPVLRYLKDPCISINDLYVLYPEGGELGWFSFIQDIKTFAYWDMDSEDWIPFKIGIQSIAEGKNITIDSTDPFNLVINAKGLMIESEYAGQLATKSVNSSISATNDKLGNEIDTTYARQDSIYSKSQINKKILDAIPKLATATTDGLQSFEDFNFIREVAANYVTSQQLATKENKGVAAYLISKLKFASVLTEDQNYVTNSQLSDIEDISNKVDKNGTDRLITLAEIDTFNSKQNALGFTPEKAGVAALLLTDLKNGVSTSGDTLKKLYDLIVSSFRETTVANITVRDAYNVETLPTNVFVLDDGDGRWALYKATTTGTNATYVKISDPDLLNQVMTASQIAAAYESVTDVNRFTNAYKLELETAYSWGNHATAGYLKSELEPAFTAWNKSTGISITSSQISDFPSSLKNPYSLTINGASGYSKTYDGSMPISITYSDVNAAPASTVTFPGFGTTHYLSAYGDHVHSGTYEPIIAAGYPNQYWRGDKTWQLMPTTLPASDVYAWAKSSVKPSYAYSEISGTPTIPTSLPASDVYSWAKAVSKPSYSYSEISGTPDLSGYATHRGEGTNFIDYARLVYNNGAYSGSGWTEPSDLGVRYANSSNYSNFIYPVASINSRNGYGIQSFYSWSNESMGYCNGITMGSNPGDTNYGWQIYQRMWDETIYFRRYNGGYGSEFYLWSNGNFTPSNYQLASTAINTSNIGSQSVNYANTAGRAYPYRSDGTLINFYWSGQGGQPSWLWGGSDGTNMYVYNPSNFSVNYANTAGSAPASDVYAWAKASSKPSYAFSELSSHPTTVSGYGITDAVTGTPWTSMGYLTGISSTQIINALGYTPSSISFSAGTLSGGGGVLYVSSVTINGSKWTCVNGYYTVIAFGYFTSSGNVLTYTFYLNMPGATTTNFIASTGTGRYSNSTSTQISTTTYSSTQVLVTITFASGTNPPSGQVCAWEIALMYN
jgi:hypothetical protein